jgi:hypothetical protein
MPLLALALASALLAALVATLLLTIPTLAQIEEPWNIVVVSEALTFARLTFIVALAHALILGLPLFFFLRSIHRLGIASCVLAGFLVGAVSAVRRIRFDLDVWGPERIDRGHADDH